MGVFEDVVIKAKNAADFAGKKTNEIVEISKLRISQSELEEKIGKEFESLGKIVYDSSKKQTDCADAIAEKSASVDVLNAQLSQLRDKISKLKAEKVCPGCGTANAQDAKFCKECGTQL